MNNWKTLAEKDIVEKTMARLKQNGINSFYVNSGVEAKAKLFEIIPAGAEIMNHTSTTLIQIDAVKEIVESGKYNSVRAKLLKMDSKTQGHEMKKMGAISDWAVASVHAVTQKGELMWASASGSQIPAYAYGADHLVFVVGTHKIVSDWQEGFKRIYDFVLPLENERAKKAYGAGSSVNRLFTLNNESNANRTTVIFVNEVLGF